jgi:hypothetical protein
MFLEPHVQSAFLTTMQYLAALFFDLEKVCHVAQQYGILLSSYTWSLGGTPANIALKVYDRLSSLCLLGYHKTYPGE